MINNRQYVTRILTATAGLMIATLSGCKMEQAYTPLSGQVYISQTKTAVNTGLNVEVAKSATTTQFNIQVSEPAKEDIQVQYLPDAEVVKAYNQVNGTELEPLPLEGYKLIGTSTVIKKGEVLSDPIVIEIPPLSQELKDSGKSYAIGFRIASPGGSYTLLDGCDRIVYILKQKAIQPVLTMNSSSNLRFNLAEEHGLVNWTVEFLVKADLLGKRHGQLNNQALFGGWGSGAEVDGEHRDGEIFCRFGDAPIEGNRFQIKTKGTQLNSNMLFEENTWYHIAMVCADTKLYIYVNGELDNQLDLPAGKVWLGKTPGFGNTDYLRANVQVAQLRLWEVARTPKQLQDNMYNCNPQSEGLIGYWRLDEGTGNTFKDATGKNPDATVPGGGSVVWTPDVMFK